MPRPDPALLAPERYPFHCAIPPRYADLDTNQHLNNVALLALIEDARVRFQIASGFRAAHPGASTVVASMAVEYLAEGRYPAPLDLYLGVTTLGRTSFGVDTLMRQESRTILFNRVVVVAVAEGSPAPLSEAFRATALAWMLRDRGERHER